MKWYEVHPDWTGDDLAEFLAPDCPPHARCGTNAGYTNLMRWFQRHPKVERVRCDPCTLSHNEFTSAGERSRR